jgi:lipopolysaccharide transport system ATP-binding protein
VRTKDGYTAETFNIQEPVGIEMSYEVLAPGYVLTPKVDVINEEGTHLFASHDVGSEWRRQERPEGLYLSTIWIPGNFLSEGNVLVHASIITHTPATAAHLHVANALTFQVVDKHSPNTARGDYVGPIPGVVRPLLNWDTSYIGTLKSKEVLDNFAGASP